MLTPKKNFRRSLKLKSIRKVLVQDNYYANQNLPGVSRALPQTSPRA